MGLESWLIGGRAGRERLVDMDRRLRPLRRLSFGVLGVCAAGALPWIGAAPLVPLALAAAVFLVADRRLAAGARPGPTIAGSWAAGQVLIAIAVVLAGGLGSPLAAWLALATVTLSARFTARGVLAGVLFTLALLVGAAFAAEPAATLADPPRLVFPALLVVCVALLSTALMRSELEHRSEAAVDGLTGLPNRRAAASRARELAEQSRLSPQPVGLVLADLDRFKAVNDTAGHATGDRVLSTVAERMREALGRTGRAYRLSGEEFLILLPGVGLDGTAAIAERVRAAVRELPMEGRTVTISCGVAASRPGAPFDYEALFAIADAALYDAKRLGRDRVAGGPQPGPEPQPEPEPATTGRRPAGSAAA